MTEIVLKSTVLNAFGENDTLLLPERYSLFDKVMLYSAYCSLHPHSTRALKEVQRALEFYAKEGENELVPNYDIDNSLKFYRRLRKFLVEGIDSRNVRDLLKKIYVYCSMVPTISERDLLITAAVVTVGCRHKGLLVRLFTAALPPRRVYEDDTVLSVADLFIGIVRKLHCSSHYSRFTALLALHKYAAVFQYLFITEALSKPVK